MSCCVRGTTRKQNKPHRWRSCSTPRHVICKNMFAIMHRAGLMSSSEEEMPPGVLNWWETTTFGEVCAACAQCCQSAASPHRHWRSQSSSCRAAHLLPASQSHVL
eukprot:361135-Chlamydomonas_euryale.AAC.10